MPDIPDEPDGQDLAEIFDETNITPDGEDIATSDLQPNLFDATSADEDADDGLAPDDDFDPDALDEAEYEEVVLAEEDLDEPRSFARSDADLVTDDDEQPEDLEAGEATEDATERPSERALRPSGGPGTD
ncbi:MAG TPA: hypothetical protein VGL58_03235 [Caulobacteraceae bacterium]|jgi:hypothetical protein